MMIVTALNMIIFAKQFNVEIDETDDYLSPDQKDIIDYRYLIIIP